MSVTANEIKTLAQSEDDFRHELLIGKTMRTFGSNGLVQIQHGGAYNDPLTGKPRQFDFRALIRRGACEAQLAVEGKRINPAAPIVVCGVARSNDEAFHELIVSISRANAYGTYAKIEQHKGDLYHAGAFVGKSVFRAKNTGGSLKKEGDGEIFERYAQALSSSVELASRACATANQRGISPYEVWSAVLPIVVVPDGTLWCVKYDADGNFDGQPVQRDSCEIFTANTILTGCHDQLAVEFRFSHVHIQTLKGFSDFLNNLVNGDLWVALFGR